MPVVFLRPCYKAKSTIQFDGGFRKSSFWSETEDSVTFRDPETSRLANQLPSEDFLAKCHWHFSPPPSRREIEIQPKIHTFKKPPKMDGVLNGRVEHTLHELLNSLLEDYTQTIGVLDELRNACNTKIKTDRIANLVF